MSALKSILLIAPDSQLDTSMKNLIREKWDDEPTSIQILEVLDQCIYGSLASGFTVTCLQSMYDAALNTENKKHEDNVPLATWRH